MNILFLTPTLPYPPDSGGRIVVYNTIKHLSRIHRISLLSLAENEHERYIPYLKKYCHTVQTAPDLHRDSSYRLVRNLFSSVPYNISKYHSDLMRTRIRQLTQRERFDLIFFEHLHMAQYIDLFRGVPVFLRQHNIETVMMQRYYRNASNPLEKAYAYLQWKKLRRYESRTVSRFDCCVVLSQVDHAFLRTFSPRAKTAVVPCGVDLGCFTPGSGPQDRNKVILIGNLLFKPTFEGALCFVNQIWPLIKKKREDVTLHIVGPYPPERKAELAQHPDVKLWGYVKDIRPHIQSAALEVVPLQIASGIRLKILEAMAMGLPIVSTSVGCEGLQVVSGKHLLVADSPENFAEKVLALLEDEKLRSTLTLNSFKLIRERYSWEKVAAQLNELCLSVGGGHPPSIATR